MKLKNKILIILFIIISLFLIINNNLFAAEGDFNKIQNFQISDSLDWNTLKVNFTNEDINNIDNYLYHVFYIDSNGLNLICSNNVYEKSGYFYSSGIYYAFTFSDSGEIKIRYFNDKDYIVGFCENNLILSSDKDIYDENGEILVFQAPPQVGQIILAPIVEETETQKTLAEVVGILPMILVVVVSYLGLRKALKMLSALLHRS